MRQRSPWPLVVAVAVTVTVGIASVVTRADRVPPPIDDSPQYVALGDSFTAGGRIGRLQRGGTDCLRSRHNYPSLVAKELGYRLRDVSCYGASTKDVLEGGKDQPAQITAVSPKTEQVTVSIGGNDLGIFSSMFLTCVRTSQAGDPGAPCRRQFETTLARRMLLVTERVGEVLDQVAERAPRASVLLINYLRLMPDGSTCEATPFAADDVAWFAGLEERLSDAVKAAGEQRDLPVVDAHALSEDHDICSGDDAWVNGPRPKANDGLLFHPNGAGEQALAAAVVEQFRK